jgi:hypothetical protein
MKKALVSALVNAGLALAPLVLLEGAFRLLPVSEPPALAPVSAASPVARFEPNVDYRYSRDWNFSVVTRKHSNNYGFIQAADFRADAATPLLAVIGDSFVEANVVNAGESLTDVLEAGLSGKGRVYGFAMSGAPLSQYLVYADYARQAFRPDAMAFVIIGNDFDESLLELKSEGRFHYFAADGKLQRVDYAASPAKKLLRRSALLRYVMLNLEAQHRLGELAQALRGEPFASQAGGAALEKRLAASRRAVDLFLGELPARSGLAPGSILFVLDGVRPALYAADTLAQAEQGHHGLMRRYFAEQAAARGYAVLDMQPVFIRRHELDGARFEVASTDSHWNALGHRVVAEEIGRTALFQRLFPGRRADPLLVSVKPAP